MPFNLDRLKSHHSDLLNLLTETLSDMLWVKDLNGNYIYANKAICDELLMANDTQEPIGKNDLYFAHRERLKHKENPKWHTFGELCFDSDKTVIENGKAMKFEEYGNVKGEMLYLEVYKAPFYDKSGKIIGTVGAGRDITQLKNIQLDLSKTLQELQAQREILEYQANYDYLTHLPNRTQFMNRLSQVITKNLHNGTNSALLFIDLDHFKEINDSLGHYIGDRLLIEFAKRIHSMVTKENLLARLGGDEFCLILGNIDDLKEIDSVIMRLKELINEPFDVEGHWLYIGISVGVAISPSDGSDPDELLKNADAAMYSAKNNGRNRYSFYNPSMTLQSKQRIGLESALRKALHQEEFEPYFQPQIDATTGEIIGMEVLMQWINGSRVIAPDTFLQLAEDTGMIVAIDRLIMQKALKLYLKWQKFGLYSGTISFNLSSRQIEDNSFLEFVRKNINPVLEHYPNSIELEVTETQIMLSQNRSIKVLEALKSFGLTISIDDFGTGYSSLAYLKKLPISKLKIDRSFVEDLPHNVDDAVIATTIIGLAKNLKLKVIAKGVVTKAQVDFLVEHGCSTMQGYYFSKALNYQDMQNYLTLLPSKGLNL